MNGYYADWARHFNISVDGWNAENEFDQDYLDTVLNYSTAESQVFGLRIQWESLEDLSIRLKHLFPDRLTTKQRFSAAFGTRYFIHLYRKDKVAQAVSLYKAKQSGLWHRNSDGTERERLKQGNTPVYNYSALNKLVADLSEYNSAWLRWFADQNINPITITYEELSDSPKIVLRNLLSHMGLDPTVAETVEPKTVILLDKESERWIDRFKKEQQC